MRFYILALFAVLFWSGNFIVGKYISSDIHPIQLALYRWFLVFLILMPYMIIRFKNIYAQLKKHYIILTVQGTLAIAGFNTLIYFGFQTTTATNALIINSSIPIIIVVFSSIILKQHIEKIQVGGILLSTFGVLYLVSKGNIDNIVQLKFTDGDIWIILACFIWALYTVLLKYKPQDLNGFEFFGLLTFIGTLILFIIFLFSDQTINLEILYKKELMLSIIYIVLFPSLLSYSFWNISTAKLTPNVTGQFSHLMPIFGSFLAYLFLDEILYLYHYIGILLIALGIYFSIFYRKK
jgi:drug/metabolite transporter (DMT)-like permease